MKLPFKPGDKVRIERRPPTYSSACGGRDGRDSDSVEYPHTFTVEKIQYKSDTDHVAIYDGRYGWTYSDLMKKVGGGSSKFTEVKEEKTVILKRRY